jgi:hypothetical protein
MTHDELQSILDLHRKWIYNEPGGSRANLSGANLHDASLHGADLHDADLSDANLSCADLSDANLSCADLSDASLHGADLSGASLRGADLRGANLRGADLLSAYLLDASLLVAYLLGANLSGASLDYSCWPLWCGSRGVTLDIKQVRQLAAHLCAVDCDDPEWMPFREALLPFARLSHRADHLGLTGGGNS